MTDHPARNPLAAFFGVVLRGRTYLNVVYLWLSFPLGLFYFIALVTLLALGAGLAILWIGFAILFFTLLGAWGAAVLERALAVGLLGAEVPPMRRERPAVETPGTWLRGVFAGATLWKGLAFLFLKFPLGLAGWIVSVTTLSVSGALAAAPVIYALGGSVDLDFVLLLPGFDLRGTEGWGDALLLGAIGWLLLFVTLHLHNALAYAWARFAELMLGAGRATAVEPPPPTPSALPVAT
jgi:hypothetical protein